MGKKSKARQLRAEENNFFVKYDKTAQKIRGQLEESVVKEITAKLNANPRTLTDTPPAISQLTASVTSENRRLTLEVAVKLDHGSFEISKKTSRTRKVKMSGMSTYNTMEEWIQAQVNGARGEIVHDLLVTMPGSVEDLVKQLKDWNIHPNPISCPNEKRPLSFKRFVERFQEQEVPKLEEKAKEILSSILQTRNIADGAPETYLAGYVDDFRITITPKQNAKIAIELNYIIRYNEKVWFKYNASSGMPYSLLTAYVRGYEYAVDDLKDHIGKVLETYLKNQNNERAYCSYLSITAPRKFQIFCDILSRVKRYSSTHVQGYCASHPAQKARDNNHKLFIAWDEPVRILTYNTDSHAANLAGDLHWEEYEEFLETTYTARTKRGPNSVCEFLKFLGLAQKAYEKALQEDTDLPEASFTYDPLRKRLSNYSVGGYDGNINSDELCEQPIGKWLDGFFARIAAIESRKHNREEIYTKALSEKNLTRLDIKILEDIYKEGRMWYTKLCGDIYEKPQFTHVAIGERLTALCSVCLPNEMEKPVPVIDFEWTESRKHGEFRLYKPQLDIPLSVFSKVTTRPYDASDMGGMEPKARDKWVLDSCRKATSKDELWRALQILDKTTKAFVGEFVKSDDGKAFFSRLEGDDAVYASLMLQSIPGCKTFAKSLLPSA